MRPLLITSTCLVLILGAAVSRPAVAQSIGSAFTYQGHLENAGTLVDGLADLELTLWDAEFGGAQIGPTLTFNSLQVSGGFFSLNLDFGASAWNGSARWLEISSRVPAGGGTFVILPRQKVMPVPFALTAVGLSPGNIGLGGVSNPLFPLTFSNTLGDKISLYGNADNHYGFGVQPSLLQMFTEGINADISFGFKNAQGAMVETMRVQGDGRVGVGTSNPRNALHVVGNAGTLTLEGADHTFMEFFPDGLAAGRAAYFGFAGPAADNIVLRNQRSNAHVILGTTGAGNVGIGFVDGGAPAAKLDVNGNLKATGFQLTGNGAGAGKVLSSDASGVASWINAPSGSQWTTAGSNIHYSSGNVGIGNSNPTTPLSFASSIGDKIRLWGTGSAFYGLAVQANQLQLFSDAVGSDVVLGYKNAAGAFIETMRVKGNGNVGIGTSTPTSKFDVAGVCRVDTLEIDAGADLAENFDIAAAVGDVTIDAAPGMVVSIDPRHVGKLIVTSRAYDRRVAGIVSGAGGVNPGLTLSQPGTVADGAHPVASVGRVWCFADADAGGPIEAGDILTTSGTPGHAMKALDPARAPGATVGKAMSSLSEGKGLVLVLVSLQ